MSCIVNHSIRTVEIAGLTSNDGINWDVEALIMRNCKMLGVVGLITVCAFSQFKMDKFGISKPFGIRRGKGNPSRNCKGY